jgi:predicted permease
VALLTLALGTGANTAIFSVLNSVMLKPLPFPESDNLVGVWHKAPGLGFDVLESSPATYFLYQDEGRTFEHFGLWNGGSAAVTGIAEPEQVEVLRVTHGTLPALGIPPLHGRWFLPEDDLPQRPETVILTHGYWQSKFNSQPAAVGQKLLVDGRPKDIIGVMPAAFRFLNQNPALILPTQLDRSEVFVGNFSYRGLARLKPGASMEQANADVARMLPMLLDRFPLAPGISRAMFEQAKFAPNVRPLKQDLVGDVGNVLWVLMAAVGIVLFIACANVANLLLVRAEGRQQELAVRAALGASRSAIARELLTDTVTLSLLGGMLGLGVAYAALRLLLYLNPSNLPRLQEIAIDPWVLAFAFATSLVCGLLFGLVPVIKYGRPNPAIALRAGSRTFSQGRERHRAQRSLVVLQVAMAVVLLIGSGLMIRTFQALQRVEPGFTNPQSILTLRLTIPGTQAEAAERVARMHNDIVDSISAIPGVRSVAASNSITMDGGHNNDPIFVENQPASENQLPPIRRYKHISPGLFETMGNPILAGRDFTWTDVYEMRPAVLISENLAREYWDSPSAALGKRVRENLNGTWREIIGVVGNERDSGVSQDAPKIVYWPLLLDKFWGFPMEARRSLTYAIRSERTGSESLLNEVQKAIWSVNPNLPIASVRTVQEIYDRSLARTSFTLVMLAIAGAMALLLGAVGLYGVIAYSISQRTREIGIRIALGASQGKVRGMFVQQGLWLVAIGVAAGLAAAVPLTRLMSALLFEISPMDPTTYIAVSAALILAALLATYIPARKATKVQPVEALRAE